MSRSNFYRKVKSLFGISPNDYMKTYRLRKAAGYQIITLENGNLHLKNNVNLPSFMLQ